MTNNYKTFFGLTTEPFDQDIRTDKLYLSKDLLATWERFLYTIKIGAIAVVTGDVGSGKTTSLRDESKITWHFNS